MNWKQILFTIAYLAGMFGLAQLFGKGYAAIYDKLDD